MSLTILHLSDLHAGPHELKDEDQKQKIPQVQRARLLERLGLYLESLPKIPDYLVITGDFTIAGDRQGLEQVKEWLVTNERFLPPPSHVLITPGNHDVTWAVEESHNWQQQRYGHFWELFALAYPHAYIPECDPKLDSRNPVIDNTSVDLIGGLHSELDHGAVKITESHPFILDLQNDLLLFAFNSSLASGIFRRPDSAVIDSLDGLAALSVQRRFRPKIQAVSDSYKRSLLIDSGYVGDDQLNYFARLMTRIRVTLGRSRYERLTKIALLHHHVSHLWEQQLEVKNFESVIDAAQLKQRLSEYRFHMVLHGHKHTNHVALDGSMVSVADTQSFQPICIVSGGTVGGYPKLNDVQSFKIISLNEAHGPRTTASILQVPLLDRGEPETVMKSKAVIYNVPIFAPIPGVHDLGALKKRIEAHLKDKLTPELINPQGSWVAGEGAIPPGIPDLVGETAAYKFDYVATVGTDKTFYDFMLAVSKIDFRQRARIYMFLSYVRALGDSCRVVLVVGNLEGTHFFRGAKYGEVGESIEKLRKWFAPAVASQLLQLRIHTFTQDEVEAIARMATEN